MSEPGSEKSMPGPTGNGRAKVMSEEQQDIKAGEEVAKEAAAINVADDTSKKARRKTPVSKPKSGGEGESFPANVSALMFAWRNNGEDVLERVREAASEALSGYESTNANWLGAFSESQRKSLDFVQAQLQEQTQLWRSISGAKTPLEAFKLQQDYALHAFKACAEQMNEIRNLWSDAAKEGIAPIGEGFERLRWWNN